MFIEQGYYKCPVCGDKCKVGDKCRSCQEIGKDFKWMEEEIYNTCDTCRYWEQFTNSSHGTCRRSSPVIVPGYNLDGHFPNVHGKNWCGKWKEKLPTGVPF